MEDVKKLLDEYSTYLSSSSEENDSENESSIWRSKYVSDDVSYGNCDILDTICSNSTTKKKRNGEKRMPTRRPDPNVYNRNALLARENRRKKKVYLETIEKELLLARKSNRSLAKALKRQLKIAQHLKKEKTFFENLVRKRSGIMTFTRACHDVSDSDGSPFSTASTSDDHINTYVKDGSSTRSISSCLQNADALSIEFDTPSDGSVALPTQSSFSDLSSIDFYTFPEFFTDMDNCTDSSLPSTTTTWDDIWGDKDYNINNIPSGITILPPNDDLQNYPDDHCYVSTSKTNCMENVEQRNEPNSCIHIEEYCSHTENICICKWNPTCATPPLQLLSEQS